MSKDMRTLFGIVLLVLLSVHVVDAGSYIFWKSGAWENKLNWSRRVTPIDDEKAHVLIEKGAEAVLSSPMTVKVVKVGADGFAGTLILDGSEAKLTTEALGVGRVDGDAGNLKVSEGALIVRNGATLISTQYIGVGYHGTSSRFDLYDGSVTTEKFWHNGLDNDVGDGGISTLYGGVLTTEYLKMEGGVLNIAGGTLRVRRELNEAGIAELIKKGRIWINGSANAVLNVNYTVEKIDEYTVVRSISSSSALG